MRAHRLVAAAAMLALAGCGDDTSPTDVPANPTPPATAPGATQAAGDAPATGFIDTVRSRLPEVAADRRDEEIEEIARQACTSLADGTGADAVITQARSLGTPDAEAADAATARELIKLAIDTTCPDQAPRVDEF